MALQSKRASTSVLKSKKKSTAASTVGAPAQHNQSSRKGKKAWRKNVDIEDLEEKLESLREEERTLGCVFFFFLPTTVILKSTIARHYKKRPIVNCLSSIPKATIKARHSLHFSHAPSYNSFYTQSESLFRASLAPP